MVYNKEKDQLLMYKWSRNL